jgi:hypothetical protein
MTRTHEKLLIAVLAGIIITGAAAFAIQPAMASAVARHQPAVTAPAHDILTLRLAATA